MPWPTPGFSCSAEPAEMRTRRWSPIWQALWPMIRMYSAVTTVMAMRAENVMETAMKAENVTAMETAMMEENVMVMAAGDVTVMEMASAGSRNPTKKRKKMEMLLSSGTEAAFFSCVSTVLSLE